jgi:hypothetical protein
MRRKKTRKKIRIKKLKRKRKTRKGRKRRRKKRRRTKKNRSQREFFEKVAEPAFEFQWSMKGGSRKRDPQIDLYDAIRENNEPGVKQAIHNGAKVNHIKKYYKPSIVDGEVVMKEGQITPIIAVIQGKGGGSGKGIAEQILGNRVGRVPGIDLSVKDHFFNPPKSALQFAKEKGPMYAELAEKIKERAAADAGESAKDKSVYEGGEVDLEFSKKEQDSGGKIASKVQKIALQGGARRTRKGAGRKTGAKKRRKASRKRKKSKKHKRKQLTDFQGENYDGDDESNDSYVESNSYVESSSNDDYHPSSNDDYHPPPSDWTLQKSQDAYRQATHEAWARRREEIERRRRDREELEARWEEEEEERRWEEAATRIQSARRGALARRKMKPQVKRPKSAMKNKGRRIAGKAEHWTPPAEHWTPPAEDGGGNAGGGGNNSNGSITPGSWDPFEERNQENPEWMVYDRNDEGYRWNFAWNKKKDEYFHKFIQWRATIPREYWP